MTVLTLGHSTHPIETFLALMTTHQLARLVDVRSYPSSRRWPQFNQADLQRSLDAVGIHYAWCAALGGRRKSKRTDSPHAAWQLPAFRAYADYAETPDFAAALEALIQTAADARTAIMCSEGLWWRCHRRIISDHLTVHGVEVTHILPDGKTTAHALPDFATVIDHRIVYDGRQQSLNLT